MRRLFSLSIAIFLFSGCVRDPIPESNIFKAPPATVHQHVTPSESQRLNEWFEREYEKELLWSPMTLTRLGSKERYGEIDDFSEVAEISRLGGPEGTGNAR